MRANHQEQGREEVFAHPLHRHAAQLLALVFLRAAHRPPQQPSRHHHQCHRYSLRSILPDRFLNLCYSPRPRKYNMHA